MADNDKKYVPQLRFPEFVNDGEWVEKRLGDICDTYSGGTPSVGNRDYYGGQIPFIRSGEIACEKAELYLTELGLQHSSAKIVEKGTLLYALYGATSGEIAISKLRGAINQAVLAILPKENYSKEYIYYFLKYNKQYIITRYLQGGQGNLSAAIINSLPILFPSEAYGTISLLQQRKIADCLSSLDGYIDATKKKLEQLKEHKRGLMQKLFPAKGKPVPEIRFPEFRNDGAWNILNLADIIHTITPSKKLKSSEYNNNGKFPIIDQSQNYIAGYSDDSSALLNIENKTCVIFGDHTCSLKLVDFPFIQGADGIKIFYSGTSCITTSFLYAYLSAHPILSKEYKRHFSELKEIDVLYPVNKKEQDKISESFTSIGESIDRCINKINTLELFKSGLMQQLFPEIAE